VSIPRPQRIVALSGAESDTLTVYFGAFVAVICLTTVAGMMWTRRFWSSLGKPKMRRNRRSKRRGR
jgi:hypothetical protein